MVIIECVFFTGARQHSVNSKVSQTTSLEEFSLVALITIMQWEEYNQLGSLIIDSALYFLLDMILLQ